MSLSFGSVRPGATSSLKTITVKNTGTSDLVIGSIDITGTNASEFSQTNNCTNITAGASCVVSGTFAPTPPSGNKSAIVSITSNDPAKLTVNVKLSGTTAVVPRDAGGVLLTSGRFGALMVGGRAGEMLLPMVDRDGSGNATRIT
ncbi:MAG TPA: choice-of-anchor D domain-containing protein [Syntrophorhabdaceae bacterium]